VAELSPALAAEQIQGQQKDINDVVEDRGPRWAACTSRTWRFRGSGRTSPGGAGCTPAVGAASRCDPTAWAPPAPRCPSSDVRGLDSLSTTPRSWCCAGPSPTSGGRRRVCSPPSTTRRRTSPRSARRGCRRGARDASLWSATPPTARRRSVWHQPRPHRHVRPRRRLAAADHRTALDRYETVLRPYMERAQRLNPGAAHIANPRSRAGVGLLRTVLKAAASPAADPRGAGSRTGCSPRRPTRSSCRPTRHRRSPQWCRA